MPDVPLHTDASSDPAGRRTIVSCFDFYAAVQVYRAFTVLVIAEGLDGSGSKAGRSSANMAATWRLVVPWMRVSAQRASQWSDRKSTRLNSSHLGISYAVFCLKKKRK